MHYFFHFLAGTSVSTTISVSSTIPFGGSGRGHSRRARHGRRRPAPQLDGSGRRLIEISDESGRLIDCVSLAEAAFGPSPEHRYRRIFEHSPLAYLLLTPDLTIIEANRAYLRATMTDSARSRDDEYSTYFPDNPGDPEANGVRNLSARSTRSCCDKVENRMPVQRFDIRRPDGAWEDRYWRPTNVPVLDHNGDVEFILHHPMK